MALTSCAQGMAEASNLELTAGTDHKKPKSVFLTRGLGTSGLPAENLRAMPFNLFQPRPAENPQHLLPQQKQAGALRLPSQVAVAVPQQKQVQLSGLLG